MGAIHIPQLDGGAPESNVGNAPLTGASVPRPGLFPVPDYGDITRAIQSGYSRAAAAAVDVHAEAKLRSDVAHQNAEFVHEGADIARTEARNSLITSGMQIFAQSVGAVQQAYKAVREQQDSLYALRTIEEYRQEYDMAATNASTALGDPDTYLGTVNAIRAELMPKYNGLAQNDNQRVLIQKGIIEYNIAAEHAATQEYNRKIVSSMGANAQQALDLSQARAIYTDDPSQIALARKTKNATLVGGPVETADGVKNFVGIRGIEGDAKIRDISEKWEDKMLKGRLEREVSLRPGEFVAGGYKEYQPGGRFVPTADQNVVSDYLKKANDVLRANQAAARADVQFNQSQYDRQAKFDADKYVSNFVMRMAPGVKLEDRPTFLELRRVLEDERLSPHIDPGLKERLTSEIMSPEVNGGVTDPAEFQRVHAAVILGNVKSVQEIYANRQLSLKDASVLAKSFEDRQGDGDPVAKRWEYKDGREILRVRLGSKVLDPFGLKLATDADAKAFTDALTKYDNWAHASDSDLSKATDAANMIVERVLSTHPGLGFGGGAASISKGGGTKGPGAINMETPEWLKSLGKMFGLGK
jgi:hypothetical protein